MLANYGYKDASGDFFITIDTDKCNGCKDCTIACPSDLLIVLNEDPNDPLREEPVAVIDENKKKKIKYECNPCKKECDTTLLPCIKACSLNAISHSW